MHRQAAFTDVDARRIAEAIGLLGVDGPLTSAILITPGRREVTVCARCGDEPEQHLPELCAHHAGPIVLISSRRAGSTLRASDIARFDAAIEVAAAFGALLVDWLVVDDDGVASLGWEGLPGWFVAPTPWRSLGPPGEPD